MSDLDEFYIRACLDLARKGEGKTHPNPMVGSIVLDINGNKAGEGFHRGYGKSHAEVEALEQAGKKAEGGTLYVNLEPCNHFGKTPPCADKILSSSIRNVIIGMTDPNPHVKGHGIEYLKEHGLNVKSGILKEECEHLNEAFVHFIKTGRPFVILKLAMTLDGKIATRNNKSRWITGESARAWVHKLRSRCDAILTTAASVYQDDSLLTVRDAPILGKAPVRIVLDRKLRLDPDKFKIFQSLDASSAPLWVFTQKRYSTRPFALRAVELGAKLFEVEDDGEKLNLIEIMTLLGQEKITQLMVESGGNLAASLIKKNMLNKLWLMYGNKILADPYAKPGFSGSPKFSLQDAVTLNIRSHFSLEDTLVVESYIK